MPVKRAPLPAGYKRPLSFTQGISLGCIGTYMLCGVMITVFLPSPRTTGIRLQGLSQSLRSKFGTSSHIDVPSEPQPLVSSAKMPVEEEKISENKPVAAVDEKLIQAAAQKNDSNNEAQKSSKDQSLLKAKAQVGANKMSDLEVLERIAYWKRPKLTKPLSHTFPTNKGKYITMEVDHGGFNNVRMGFEAVILSAMVLGRIFVIPPPCPWYLINWGPIQHELSKGSLGGQSSLHDFFDVEDLGKVIPVISTEEFLKRHTPGSSVDLLEIPAKDLGKTVPGKECTYPLAKWLRGTPSGVALAGQDFNLLSHVVMWPNISAVMSGPNKPPDEFIAGRRMVELTPELQASTVVHFAMDYEKDHRYLGQVAAMFAFEDLQHQKEVFRALRDGFHYKHQVFEAASKVVARLGFEGYAAFHVRRNDLQYKEAYVPASKSLDAAGELIRPKEVIYLATDEMDPKFFDDWERRGHKVWRYGDFFEDKGGKVLEGVEGAKDPSLVGLIEQIICACARIFFQTPNSTFSSYITRLRGHIDVSNHNVYYHTKGPYKAESQGERENGIRNNIYVEYSEVFELDRRRRRRLLGLEE